MSSSLKTTGVRNGVLRVINDSDGIALYVQSSSSTQQAMVIDGGSTTSGSILTVYSPEDIPSMIAAGGVFFEFSDKGQGSDSTFTFAPDYMKMGSPLLPYIERFTYYGGGNGTSTQTATLTGTVSITNGSPVVTGSGTSFHSNFKRGDTISVATNAGGTAWAAGGIRVVESVDSNTQITCTSNFANTWSGRDHRGYVEQYKPATIQLEGVYGNHDQSDTADFMHNLYISGGYGHLRKMKSSSEGDLTPPSDDGEGNAISETVAVEDGNVAVSGASKVTILTWDAPALGFKDNEILEGHFVGEVTAGSAGVSTVTFRAEVGSSILTSNSVVIPNAAVTDFSGVVRIIGTSSQNQKVHISVAGKDTGTSGGANFIIEETGSLTEDMRLDKTVKVTMQVSNDGTVGSVKFGYFKLL